MTILTCSPTECDITKRVRRGMCNKHYLQWNKENLRPLCAIQGCEDKVTARGWCGKHYKRWKKHGNPIALPPRNLPPQNYSRFFGCLIDACNEPHEAKGYCKNHYMQHRYRENTDQIKSVQIAYREANRDRLREKARVYYAENTEQVNLGNRASYRKHVGARAAYRRNYQIENRDKVRALNNRRHALKMGAEINDLTADQWTFIKADWGQKCAYCGTAPELITMDHYIPLINGGNHTKSNIVPACLPCNSSKSDGPAPPFYYELSA